MRRLLLSALLVLATNVGAALPRVRATAAAPATRLAPPFLAASPLGALSPSVPGLAPPLASALLHDALPPIAAPLPALAVLPPSAAADASQVSLLDALSAQGALSADVAEKGGTAAAATHFQDAAGLGKLTAAQPADAQAAAAPNDGPSRSAAASGTLHDRLRAQLNLDDRGNPAEKAALEKMLRRLLQSPTARRYAEQFVSEGHTALVRFAEIENSRVIEADGRKIFYAPRAFTHWRDGRAEVWLNRDYLDSDPDFLHEDAPATLAHELLGHVLWYSRMHKEGLHLPFHMLQDNETNSKLVGWLTGWELDARFHDTYPWEYLADPAGYLENLKLRTPYYSSTFSDGKESDPARVFEERLAKVDALILEQEKELAAPRQDVALIKGKLDNFNAVRDSLQKSVDFYAAPGRFAPPSGQSPEQDERSTRVAQQLNAEFPALERKHALLVRAQELLASRSARVERFAENHPEDPRLEGLRARLVRRGENVSVHAEHVAAMHDAFLSVAAFYRLLTEEVPASKAPSFEKDSKRVDTLHGLLSVFSTQQKLLQVAVRRLSRHRARVDRIAATGGAGEERLERVRAKLAAKEESAGGQAVLYAAMKEAMTATTAYHQLALLRAAAESPLFKRLSAQIAELTSTLRFAVTN